MDYQKYRGTNTLITKLITQLGNFNTGPLNAAMDAAQIPNPPAGRWFSGRGGGAWPSL
jgi:hypothetical protein